MGPHGAVMCLHLPSFPVEQHVDKKTTVMQKVESALPSPMHILPTALDSLFHFMQFQGIPDHK